MRIQHGNGELVHLWVTSGFYHVIHTSTGDIGDAGSDVLTPIVNRAGRAQFQGKFEALGFNVNTDDRVGANEAGCHDGCQADRSGTKDGNACPV